MDVPLLNNTEFTIQRMKNTKEKGKHPMNFIFESKFILQKPDEVIIWYLWRYHIFDTVTPHRTRAFPTLHTRILKA